jgi:hypothetical protein
MLVIATPAIKPIWRGDRELEGPAARHAEGRASGPLHLAAKLRAAAGDAFAATPRPAFAQEHGAMAAIQRHRAVRAPIQGHPAPRQGDDPQRGIGRVDEHVAT